jgi:hypothetical protein
MKTTFLALLLALASSLLLSSCADEHQHHKGDGHDHSHHAEDGHKH